MDNNQNKNLSKELYRPKSKLKKERGIGLLSVLKKELRKASKSKNRIRAEELMKTLVDKAVKGDYNSIKLILNYLEGMPEQKISGNINIGLGEILHDVEILEGEVVENAELPKPTDNSVVSTESEDLERLPKSRV